MPTFDRIKTASDLKGFAENAGSYFFTRKAMAFFGDTMRNFGVRHLPGGIVELYRRKPVKHGLQTSHYWRLKEGTNDQAVRASKPD